MKKTYCIHFAKKSDARKHMIEKNREAKQNKSPFIFCLVDGPDNFFSVVDEETADDLGISYEVKF